MAEELRDPQQGDVAELGPYDGDLDLGIEFEATGQLGKDLLAGATRSPDQEDPTELTLENEGSLALFHKLEITHGI